MNERGQREKIMAGYKVEEEEIKRTHRAGGTSDSGKLPVRNKGAC